MNRRSSFFVFLVLGILIGCSTERATETASPQLPKQLKQTAPSAADAPPPLPTTYSYPTTDVAAPIPTTYPSTGIDAFDPPTYSGLHANWEARESRDVQPVRYDPVNEISVPQRLLDRKDMIGAYRDGSGFRRLTLHESGRYEYVSGGHCMYSYSGYEGDWELEGNVIRLRNARPNGAYRSIYRAAAAPTHDPFLNFDVLLLENEPILIESDKMYHFVKYGVSNRCCFRRSGDH